MKAGLHKLFDYDPAGFLRWKEAGPGRTVGAVAGHVEKSTGYRRIHCFGRRWFAHVLVFTYHHGRLPVDEIDHINRNPDDNRIENLREVSRSQNNRNRGDVVGGWFDPQRNCWRASIKVNGRSIRRDCCSFEEMQATYFRMRKEFEHV